jgi:hypothetical protein
MVLSMWGVLSDERMGLSIVKVIVNSNKSIVHMSRLSPVKSNPLKSFGLEIGFIDHLQVVTTNNYNTIANVHTL